MYAFTLLALPLGFVIMYAGVRDPGQKESALRSVFKGVVMGIPGLLLWLPYALLVRPSWGSFALSLAFLLRYWVLPFGLMTGAYALARGFRGLERGTDYRAAVAFGLGFLSVFQAAHAVMHWADRYPAYVLVLPVTLAASAFAYPVLLEESAIDGLPEGLRWLAAALGGFFLAAVALALFFLKLEWLGLVLAVLYTAGALYLGIERLGRRP